jgi:hypothetical protein
MSTLKADTIQSTGGGAATLTKQTAAKVTGTFDDVNATLDSGFNVTSGTDSATGDATFNFTNAMSSTTDRTILWGCWNTNDDGTNGVGGNSRGGLNVFQVAVAPSTSSVRGRTAYGSTASADGAAADCSAMYVAIFGDLA